MRAVRRELLLVISWAAFGQALVRADDKAEPAAVQAAPDGTPIATFEAYPPAGSARAIAGEITMVDHVNRMGMLRDDRTDAQDKYAYDLPHHFALLPYGEVFFNGARANLEDIPLGTHLHGWFHLGPRGWFKVRLAGSEFEQGVKNEPNERSPDSPWCRAIRLEDDFTCDARQNMIWEILEIDREGRKLIAVRREAEAGERLPTPAEAAAAMIRAPSMLAVRQVFDFDAATRVWSGRELHDASALAVGQRVLVNRTRATIAGPGRLVDVWVDAESRRLAAARQARRFTEHERVRGVPARIEAIEYGENASGVVTAVLHAAMSAEARESFKPKTGGAVIVAEPTLRTYDTLNGGVAVTFRDVDTASIPAPGSSGTTVRFHIHEMLEGIRPGRTVRLKASGWPRVEALREESLNLFDLRPKLIDEDGVQRTTAPFSR